MARLIVITGPERTGKYPLALKLAHDHKAAVVHRDFVQKIILKSIPETTLEGLMMAMAASLLATGQTVVVTGLALNESSWASIARIADEEFEWLDTSRPEVQAMVPPRKDE